MGGGKQEPDRGDGFHLDEASAGAGKLGGWVVPASQRARPGESPGAARAHLAGGDGLGCREGGGSWRNTGSSRWWRA